MKRTQTKYLLVWILLGIILLAPIAKQLTTSAQMSERAIRLVRSIYTQDFGVPLPQGLAYSPLANAFLVLSSASLEPGADSTTNIVAITLSADPAGSAVISSFPDPADATFDGRANRLVMVDLLARELIEIQTSSSGLPDRMGGAVARFEASQFDLRGVQGMAIDPDSGRLFMLDEESQRIVRVAPDTQFRLDSAVAANRGRIAMIDISHLGRIPLQGLAYNPVDDYLYIYGPTGQIIYELTESGALVSTYDLSELSHLDLRAMLFAPSGDATDDPLNMDLYLLDAGEIAADGSISRSGRIIELAIEEMRDELLQPMEEASLVRIIDTSNVAWNPSSPDPAGIAYWPAMGRLVISDSEVEEMHYYVGANVFQATLSGTLLSTCNTLAYSREPTGATINPNNNHIFFSDDNNNAVYEISLGPDGIYCTPDDTVTVLNTAAFGAEDSEGVAYGQNTLFIAGGIDAEVYMMNLGANGVIGGGDDGPVSHFDTFNMGYRDLEGIEFNHFSNTLFLVSTSGSDRTIGEVSLSGTFIRSYDLTFLGSLPRSGLAYAPGSINPGVYNIYMVSRGVDNGADPNENDGKVFEISLGSVPPQPTSTPTRTPTATSTRTPTPTHNPAFTPTSTVTRTQTPTATSTNTQGPSLTATSTSTNTSQPTQTATHTATPTSLPPSSNLLLNPGFELDVNNDGLPDSWSSNSIFTRSNELVRSGSYSGRFFATNNASANILQTVNDVTAGTMYDVSGWVNIPQPAGSSLSFQLKIEWRNGSTLIYRDTVKKYTGVTGGWDQAAGSLVAPPGTTNARILLALAGLNGTIFVDDFAFGLQGATPSSTSTPTNTPTSSPTSTSTVMATPASTVTATNTPTSTPTVTGEPTSTTTSTVTATAASTATATNTPTSTATVAEGPTSTPTQTSTATATSTTTNPPTLTATPTATQTPSDQPLLMSFASNGSVAGVSFADEDILVFDGQTWSFLFDGSDVGVGAVDVIAFVILDADSILMSFDKAITFGGLSVSPQDIVQFDASSLGATTSGTFSMYLDGSDVDLTTNGESIDGLALLPDGRILVSTTGNTSVPGVSGADEDILAFTPTSLGDVTSGTWALYFDGSDVGLADGNGEDIDAIYVHSNGDIFLSTLGAFSVPGVSGENEDVFICTPTSLGSVTACNYAPALYFDGSTFGLDTNDVDGISIP